MSNTVLEKMQCSVGGVTGVTVNCSNSDDLIVNTMLLSRFITLSRIITQRRHSELNDTTCSSHYSDNFDVVTKAVDTMHGNRQVILRRLSDGLRVVLNTNSAPCLLTTNSSSNSAQAVRPSSDTMTTGVLHDIMLLKSLSHENVITVHELITSSDVGPSYVVSESLSTNLLALIDDLGVLSTDHMKLFTYQLLRGLKYMHSGGLTHGALDPASLLIDAQNLTLKIGGYIRGVNKAAEESTVYCSYDAPELLMASGYVMPDCTTDIWSAGCIIVEMMLGHLLFKGRNRMDELLKITDCVHLTDDDWTSVLRVMPNKLLKNHPFRPRSPLCSRLNGHDTHVVELVAMMLTFSSTQRPTAITLLAQPYVAEYHCPADEPSVSFTVDQLALNGGFWPQTCDNLNKGLQAVGSDNACFSDRTLKRQEKVVKAQNIDDLAPDLHYVKGKTGRQPRSKSVTSKFSDDMYVGNRIWTMDDMCMTLRHASGDLPSGRTLAADRFFSGRVRSSSSSSSGSSTFDTSGDHLLASQSLTSDRSLLSHGVLPVFPSPTAHHLHSPRMDVPPYSDFSRHMTLESTTTADSRSQNELKNMKETNQENVTPFTDFSILELPTLEGVICPGQTKLDVASLGSNFGIRGGRGRGLNRQEVALNNIRNTNEHRSMTSDAIERRHSPSSLLSSSRYLILSDSDVIKSSSGSIRDNTGGIIDSTNTNASTRNICNSTNVLSTEMFSDSRRQKNTKTVDESCQDGILHRKKQNKGAVENKERCREGKKKEQNKGTEIEGGNDSDEKESADISEEKRLEDIEQLGIIVPPNFLPLASTLLQPTSSEISNLCSYPISLFQTPQLPIEPNFCIGKTVSLAPVSVETCAMLSRRHGAGIMHCSLLHNTLERDPLITVNKNSSNKQSWFEPLGRVDIPLVTIRSNGGEDSNKSLGNNIEEYKYGFGTGCGAGSRKLILDKIESEKDDRGGSGGDHGDQRGCIRGNQELSSEELDDLYRLPTDHLRKESHSMPPQRGISRRAGGGGSHDNHRNQSNQSYVDRCHSYLSHDSRTNQDHLVLSFEHNWNQLRCERSSRDQRNHQSRHEFSARSYEHGITNNRRMHSDWSPHDGTSRSNVNRSGGRNIIAAGGGRQTDDLNNERCKEDRLNIEGACGGLDYREYSTLYRTASTELSSSSIELDLQPYIEPLRLDDSLLTTPSRPITSSLIDAGGMRGTSSSPESPASPASPQVGNAARAAGARPKKSPQKHRAV